MTSGSSNEEAVRKEEAEVAELRSRLEKELTALLAHPLVPEEFKAVFRERK